MIGTIGEVQGAKQDEKQAFATSAEEAGKEGTTVA